MQTLIEQFQAIRFAGTPLVAIRTADPAATVNSIIKAQPKEKDAAPPILHWDIVRGLAHMNGPGEKALSVIGAGEATVEPVAMLQKAAGLPEGAITFVANAHRIINENGISQAVWNLRDIYKANQRTLVLLCPSITLPIELQSDVSVLDEPMPDIPQLESIVKAVYRSADLVEPDTKTLAAATDAVCGLAAFPAEQACAESITRKGLNLPALWERKRVKVEQTQGLSIWRGTATFDDMRGSENAIQFLRRLMTGKRAARAIVWQDEVEKQFAGFGGDLSGTTGEAMGMQLEHMQNTDAQGILLVGGPGTGKSMLAQCLGNTFGKITIGFNVSSTKGGIVGESEANMRQGLKVIDAVSQGRALFIATCNKFGTLPPEFRRRFRDATFYCDLPSEEERTAMWQMYIRKYQIPAKHAAIPESEGWTGAEIRQCCDLADRFGAPLVETAQYIVPVCKSAAGDIAMLRMQAHNTFISASHKGVYQAPDSVAKVMVILPTGERKLKFEDQPVDKTKVN